MPIDELTAIEVDKPDDVLWVGDETEAVIMQIEGSKRHILLSIKKRMKQYDQALDVAGKLSDKSTKKIRRQQVKRTKSIAEPEVAKKIGPIFVAEDDKYVRQSLCSWLRRKGFEVYEAGTLSQAIDFQSRLCNLYIIDLDLLGNDGLELIRHLKLENNSVRTCVMSTPDRLVERANEIEAAQVFEVFPKPLDVEELEQFLMKVARNELLPYWRVNQPLVESNSLSVAFSKLDKSYSNQLKDVLDDISSFIEAQTGIIFRFEKDTKTVSIVVHSGDQKLNLSALYGLKESPVKDVIQEGEPIFETRVTEKSLAKFGKLLNLLSFESCIGIPIKVHGEVHHAAFFFHLQTNAFSSSRLRDIQAEALLLSVILTENAVEERLLSLNPMLLSGELAASFGHDVFNKITALELEARNLADNNLTNKSSHHQKMLDLVLDLKNTVHAFQQMLRVKEKMGIVDVNYTIERAMVLLRDMARKERVQVINNLTNETPTVVGNQTFLQQAFLNIMLNAIQQMILKAKKYEWKEQPVLEISSILLSSKNMLQIRFKDNGPGIHKVHLAKLFSPGFSTRGGSGLGLYIARSFIHAIGGTLQVEESFVPLGTTFLLEIPVSTPETKK